MRAELFENSKYDGTTWVCRPLPFTRRQDDVVFYNDNPVVYGFPGETVKINGIKYQAEDLVEATASDLTTVVELTAEGEVEMVGYVCRGCKQPSKEWDWMTNRCPGCAKK